MKEFCSFSPEETGEVGWKLGKLLRAGDTVCLQGDLGTGKTAFTSGIAKALGIEGYITSPTFTIVNEYQGQLPLYHFDVYRVADPEEMFEIGFDEYLGGNGVVVVEWAELIAEALPAEYIRVTLKKDLDKGLDARIIRVESIGERYRKYEEELE